MHMPCCTCRVCTCHAHAMHMPCTCHFMYIQCTCHICWHSYYDLQFEQFVVSTDGRFSVLGRPRKSNRVQEIDAILLFALPALTGHPYPERGVFRIPKGNLGGLVVLLVLHEALVHGLPTGVHQRFHQLPFESNDVQQIDPEGDVASMALAFHPSSEPGIGLVVNRDTGILEFRFVRYEALVHLLPGNVGWSFLLFAWRFFRFFRLRCCCCYSCCYSCLYCWWQCISSVVVDEGRRIVTKIVWGHTMIIRVAISIAVFIAAVIAVVVGLIIVGRRQIDHNHHPFAHYCNFASMNE